MEKIREITLIIASITATVKVIYDIVENERKKKRRREKEQAKSAPADQARSAEYQEEGETLP